MNGKLKKTGIILVLILSGLLLGCSKSNTLIRILGTWELVNVVNVNSPEKEEWLFDVDDILTRYRLVPDTVTIPDSTIYNREVIDQGKYQIKVKFFKRYISISHFNYEVYNTDWEIVKSNKNILMIVNDKEGGLLIKEFTKKEFF